MKTGSTISAPSTGSYSSTVQIKLHAAGAIYPVLQSGEHLVRVDRSLPIPIGEAVLEVVVDGRSHRRQVQVLSPADATGWIKIASE